MIAEDLTGQANASQGAGREALLLGHGHPRRLSLDELHTAGRAACESSARVQDVDFRIFLDGADKTLVRRHIERSKSFNGQLRHADILSILNLRI
jgi:hypothetical protein